MYALNSKSWDSMRFILCARGASTPRCARYAVIAKKSSARFKRLSKRVWNAKAWLDAAAGARNTCTAFTRKCAANASRSPTLWTCMPFALWSTRPTPATAYSARFTASTSQSLVASKTILPFLKRTAISRCTLHCSACTACLSRFRSAPRKWRRWLTTASPRTGFISLTKTYRATPMAVPANG